MQKIVVCLWLSTISIMTHSMEFDPRRSLVLEIADDEAVSIASSAYYSDAGPQPTAPVLSREQSIVELPPSYWEGLSKKELTQEITGLRHELLAAQEREDQLLQEKEQLRQRLQASRDANKIGDKRCEQFKKLLAIAAKISLYDHTSKGKDMLLITRGEHVRLQTGISGRIWYEIESELNPAHIRTVSKGTATVSSDYVIKNYPIRFNAVPSGDHGYVLELKVVIK